MQFVNLKTLHSAPIKVSKRDFNAEMRSLLSTKKGTLPTDPTYGITDLKKFFMMTNDLSIIVPLVTVTLKNDIESNSDFKILSIQIFKNKDNKRAVDVFIKYQPPSDHQSHIFLLQIVSE